MTRTLLFFTFLCALGPLAAQQATPVYHTFKDTRVINVHSIETLPKHKLDVRITHRFGDFLGDNGGFQTLYGLENAADVLIGAEYGITNQFTAGIYRSSGAGVTPDGTTGLRQLMNGIFKYRILQQTTDNTMPLTLTALGVVTISTVKAVDTEEDVIQRFDKFAHRMAYHGQLLVARKFSEGFTLQLGPAFTYRNLVPFGDENGLFSLNVASRIQMSKVVGIITDFTFPFSDLRTTGNGYYPALGVGVEIETGGHVFQVNLTNARAIMETDFIPYTTSNWLDGEFRLGFTISRMFNL